MGDDDAIRLIVNADDFGKSRSANSAIQPGWASNGMWVNTEFAITRSKKPLS